jgi:hypothetical protein
MSARPGRVVATLNPDAAQRFYVDVLDDLRRFDVPFLVGGTYAFAHYVGFERKTKDLDLFARQEDVKRALELFAERGYDTELTHPHWLGKIWRGEHFIDLIFSSGNGVARVDNQWFDHATAHTVFDRQVWLSPPEEMIWSKAFVQERERYDGADVVHLIYHRGRDLDWRRLLTRFGPHWEVLYSFLVLYGFCYPADRDRVPEWLTDELTARFVSTARTPGRHRCNGPLLSREQYLHDVDVEGCRDPRLAPSGRLSPEELSHWTEQIANKAAD